ncbi:MAG: D-alanyl-D-alanine carboxypeptidase [Burkholderiales bacterium]|nr:D-alanyl-D-alanine carboxypeptidase [Burkholderiales bacterium]
MRRSRAWPAAWAAAAAIASCVVAHAATLPADVRTALERAGVPAEALSVTLLDAASGRPLFDWRGEVARNPASLAKLLTTSAALERLGPAWSWHTPVWLTGPVKDGVLEGSLQIKGSGDPKLVLERLWLLLRRVQQMGVREIRGDIVLDQSAFAPSDAAPGDFDGETLRPYNVRPAALLLNFRSVLYTFVPDAAAGVARVLMEPTLARAQPERTVPLAAGACGDWRRALDASFAADGRTRFAGSYALGCGEQTWPVADPAPASYDARLLEGLWRGMGGTLDGRVREGAAPEGAPSFELRSPALAEVVRDINKYSNNVMAEQLFLTLALQAEPLRPATPQTASALLRRWLAERLAAPQAGPPGERLGERPGDAASDAVIVNGSGLSRESRLTTRLLARLLAVEYSSPVMPELMASLPLAGSDGTLRRTHVASGRAHLKTGSLRDVSGVAGYVLPANGRRLVLVAIVNHPLAPAARPAIEALVQWALMRSPPGEHGARAERN